MRQPTILLYSGSYFSFADPHGSTFCIEDVAHALSNLCRFNGHTKSFYSVAEHSYHASMIADPKWAYEALMHDAPEAFIGDVTKPLKEMLPDYRAIEEKVEDAVFLRFGIMNPYPKEVKRVDLVMLATEQKELFSNRDRWDCLDGIEPSQVKIKYWVPPMAKTMFLSRFYELTNKTMMDRRKA